MQRRFNLPVLVHLKKLDAVDDERVRLDYVVSETRSRLTDAHAKARGTTAAAKDVVAVCRPQISE